jgi:hypothetical protein
LKVTESMIESTRAAVRVSSPVPVFDGENGQPAGHEACAAERDEVCRIGRVRPVVGSRVEDDLGDVEERYRLERDPTARARDPVLAGCRAVDEDLVGAVGSDEGERVHAAHRDRLESGEANRAAAKEHRPGAIVEGVRSVRTAAFSVAKDLEEVTVRRGFVTAHVDKREPAEIAAVEVDDEAVVVRGAHDVDGAGAGEGLTGQELARGVIAQGQLITLDAERGVQAFVGSSGVFENRGFEVEQVRADGLL